jgi:hypothetical protein
VNGDDLPPNTRLHGLEKKWRGVIYVCTHADQAPKKNGTLAGHHRRVCRGGLYAYRVPLPSMPRDEAEAYSLASRILLGLTIAQLSARLRCAECSGPLHSVKPWRLEYVLGKPLGRERLISWSSALH